MSPRTAVASDPVDWTRARRIAVRVAGSEPLADSYHAVTMRAELAELTPEAEALVVADTGLVAPGPARAAVLDRAEWVDANIASMRLLLKPLTDRMGEQLDGPFAGVTRKVGAAEAGALLGYLAKRVLGQYDLLVADPGGADAQSRFGVRPAPGTAGDATAHHDAVYFVGPNILTLEKRHGFAPREFRLWIALHEVTHRAQFCGVPWMRAHYLSLVRRVLDETDADPRRFLDALRRGADAMREGRPVLDGGGLVTLFAGAEQRAVLDEIGGLMSLLEGHGDVVMQRAAAGRVPGAERFAQVLAARRAQARGAALVMRRLIGLEAKLQQYEQGERFVRTVEERCGRAGFDRVWEHPTHLPTLAEIRAPELWIARVARVS